MHFLKQTLLILLLCFLVQTWLPWWTLIFPCFVISFLAGRSGGVSFLAGFLAVGLLWLGMSFYIDWVSASLLSSKIAQLFPGKSVMMLRVFTALVGGLTGGFASLSGYSLKALR